jgi:hypothetical protein
VIKLVMNGDEPSHVPDEIIAEIRQRERNGAPTGARSCGSCCASIRTANLIGRGGCHDMHPS